MGAAKLQPPPTPPPLHPRTPQHPIPRPTPHPPGFYGPGLTRTSYTYLDEDSLRYLFNALARPQLEQWRGADWKCTSPCIKINTRNIKFFISWSSSCYRYTKHEVSLYQRWHDSVYKILHGEDESLKALFHVNSTSITRGHKFKIKKTFVKNKVHKHFFSMRVINDWNSLLPGVVNAVSLDSFETKLDEICTMALKGHCSLPWFLVRCSQNLT